MRPKGKKQPKSYEEYYGFYKDNERCTYWAPDWVKKRENLKSCFTPYESSSADSFPNEVKLALLNINSMKHPKKNCPVFFGESSPIVDYTEVTEAEIPEHGTSLNTVVDDLTEMLVGLPNSAHPLHQANVLPNPNKAAIIASLIANYVSQNAIEGEYAWNLCKAEMETAAMIAKLIPGWNEDEVSGIFTYGGSGCYLYGVKYALAHVFRKDRCEGVPDGVKAKVLCSQQGHYAKMNSTDWLGIGMANYIDVNCDDLTNEMEISDLRDKLQECKDNGEVVVAIICTMGTTDAFAIDDVKAVRELLDNEFADINCISPAQKYEAPMIYCDAVIGWSMLMFHGYDFEENPLNFHDSVKNKVHYSYQRMLNVQYGDSMGVDFHKTGWVQYATSMFMMRDFKKYRELMSRPGSAYLQNRIPYNPGSYSLEVSRSAAPAMSAWATLKYLGLEGFRVLIGGIIEMSQFFRHVITKDPTMAVCNKEDFGFVTLFRIYPNLMDPMDGKKRLSAEEIYELELSVGDNSSKELKEMLEANNQFQKKVADNMWRWLHADEPAEGQWTPPFVSYSSGFRTTNPEDDMGSEYVIYALKSYPMNVSVNMRQMIRLYNHFKQCAKLVMEGKEFDKVPADLICEPYLGTWEPPCCKDDAVLEHQTGSLLSGVPIARKGKKVKGKGTGRG